jgi:hypothetical protein
VATLALALLNIKMPLVKLLTISSTRQGSIMAVVTILASNQFTATIKVETSKITIKP